LPFEVAARNAPTRLDVATHVAKLEFRLRKTGMGSNLLI
jgi:hypothetical protein